MTISRIAAPAENYPHFDIETQVKANGLMLSYAHFYEKDNVRIVKLATAQNPAAFSYASDRIKSDLEIILDFLSTVDPSFIKHANPMFLHDDGIVLKILEKNLHVYPFICPALMSNQSFLKEAFYVNPEVFHLIPLALQNDLFFLTSLCTKDELYQPEAIDFLVEKLDPKLKDAITQDPRSIAGLPKALKNYPPVAKFAIEKSSVNILNLEAELKNDIEFFKYLIFSVSPDIYQHAPLNLKKNTECAFLAISQSPALLEYAPNEIKDNKRIVQTAVSIEGSVFMFASERLKKDPDIAAYAFLSDPTIYETFPECLRTKPEFWSIVLNVDHAFIEGMPEECLHSAEFWSQLLEIDSELEKLSPARMYY